jgi:hypothetical protein
MPSNIRFLRQILAVGESPGYLREDVTSTVTLVPPGRVVDQGSFTGLARRKECGVLRLILATLIVLSPRRGRAHTPHSVPAFAYRISSIQYRIQFIVCGFPSFDSSKERTHEKTQSSSMEALYEIYYGLFQLSFIKTTPVAFRPLNLNNRCTLSLAHFPPTGDNRVIN